MVASVDFTYEYGYSGEGHGLWECNCREEEDALFFFTPLHNSSAPADR